MQPGHDGDGTRTYGIRQEYRRIAGKSVRAGLRSEGRFAPEQTGSVVSVPVPGDDVVVKVGCLNPPDDVAVYGQAFAILIHGGGGDPGRGPASGGKVFGIIAGNSQRERARAFFIAARESAGQGKAERHRPESFHGRSS